MNKLLIGENIFKLRKERGLTQDELADFMKVSTAAVSKWESGNSYPDITLLPELASFFNVSVDKLLSFKSGLSDDEIQKIYRECEKLFSSNDIVSAIDKSKGYISKYNSSYSLKYKIGFLFFFYSWKNTEKCIDMIKYAVYLYEDIVKNSSSIELVEESLFQLSALYQFLNKDDKAVEALKKIHKSDIDPDTMLACIYIKKNEMKRARKILQKRLYKRVNDISSICMTLLNSYNDDLSMIEKYHNLCMNIQREFSSNGNCIFSFAYEYLTFAKSYMDFKEYEKAVCMLKKMVEDLRINDINHSRELNTVWCFNELPDRKERSITINMYENILKLLESSDFDQIRENKEFIDIFDKVKKLEKESYF